MSAIAYPSVPTRDLPLRPPPLRSFINEFGVGWQGARLVAAMPRLLRAPRGAGRLTIDIPGWRSPEVAMSPVRMFLRHLGHDAQSWGLGVNKGEVDPDITDPAVLSAEFVAELERRVKPGDPKVNLVAWSLGGAIAREAARVRPDLINKIVTYGTPVIGGPAYTVGRRVFTEEVRNKLETWQHELDVTRPLQVPVTAMYTRADGIVNWRACIDHHSLDVQHVEVSSSHVGMGLDPDVWMTIAEALAEPSDLD